SRPAHSFVLMAGFNPLCSTKTRLSWRTITSAGNSADHCDGTGRWQRVRRPDRATASPASNAYRFVPLELTSGTALQWNAFIALRVSMPATTSWSKSDGPGDLSDMHLSMASNAVNGFGSRLAWSATRSCSRRLPDCSASSFLLGRTFRRRSYAPP